jgi:DNA-directed RNA polymerase specialized sigma24 family protein
MLDANKLAFRWGRAKILGQPERIPVPANGFSRTSITLLGRLRQDPEDQAAWCEFVARYQTKILQCCGRWRLQESDAHDVAPAVLLKLSRSMATFAYDRSRSFRAWLKTLTHHAWCDLVNERKREAIGSGDTGMRELFESLEAGDDMVEQFDQEFRRELMEHMLLVRPRVAQRTWDAFRLTTLEGCSGGAAARLDMKVARVYLAKSEVKKMIKDEIRKLEGIE